MDLGPMPAGVAQANVNHQFVKTLEGVLADAKAGNIAGGAVIAVQTSGNISTPLTFPPSIAPLVVAGCEFLKEEIISMVRQQQRGGGRQLLRASGAIPPTRQ